MEGERRVADALFIRIFSCRLNFERLVSGDMWLEKSSDTPVFVHVQNQYGSAAQN